MTSLSEPSIHVTAKIEGVVVPVWVAVMLSLSTLLSVIALIASLLVVQFQIRETRTAINSLRLEIRSLQLHTQDVENVLIRSGLAKRSDFAPWTVQQDNKKGK